jgi:ELWxxDGT repeat protein
MKQFYFLCLLLISLTLSAQITKVKEINDEKDRNSSPSGMFVFDGKMFFGAEDSNGKNTGGEDLGKELWASDGTDSGTMLIKDIRVGAGNSSPNGFFEFKSNLYFSAFDGSSSDLWTSDGTVTGTTLVDLFPGQNEGLQNPIELGGVIYMRGRDVLFRDGEIVVNNLISWDGVTAKSIHAELSDDGSILSEMVILNGKLLFTMRLSSDNTNDVTNEVAAQNNVGSELYNYDPTTNTFTLLKDITLGAKLNTFSNEYRANGSSISNLTTLGTKVYFEAVNELWETDGTAAGTIKVAAATTAGISNVAKFYSWSDKIFFEGDDGSGDQLWVYDPTLNTVTNISNISGSNTNHDPSDYTAFNGFLYYRGEDANDSDGHLFRTDGTSVEQIDSTIKDVDDLVVFDNKIYFEGNDYVLGKELYVFDPATANLDIVKEINIDKTINANPSGMFAFSDRIYFGAEDASGKSTDGKDLGKELWASDGTDSGTMLIKDIRVGAGNSSPNGFFEFKSKLYFSAFDGSSSDLWTSDGTATGTTLVDLFPGQNEGLQNPIELGGVIYMRGRDVLFRDGEIVVNNLISWDGVTAKSIHAELSDDGSILSEMVILNGKLLFTMRLSSDNTNDVTNEVAAQNNVGSELYNYDPTTNTFTLLKDITLGAKLNTFSNEYRANGSSISNLTTLGTKVYFEAVNELWETDGTAAGTIKVAAAKTAGISNVTKFYSWSDKIFFEGDDGSGDQLWVYDPTLNTVTNISNISGSNTNHDPSDYTAYNGFLYYRGEDANDSDGHLFRTDGTSVEQMDSTIKDVDDLVVMNSKLYFEGDDGVTGNELYVFESATASVSNVTFRNAITIYPNPSSSFVKVKGDFADEVTYQIFNLLGKRVQTGTIKNNLINHNLKNGLYIIKLKSGTLSATRKIIVKQ